MVLGHLYRPVFELFIVQLRLLQSHERANENRWTWAGCSHDLESAIALLARCLLR